MARARPEVAYLVEAELGWRSVSWQEAGQAVDELANGFLARGLGKGDRVAIIGATHLEWSLVDFALASIGAVTVPLYPNSSARDCAYVLEHSEAVAAVADEPQLPKLEGAGVRQVFVFGDLQGLRDDGRGHAAREPGALDTAAAAVGEDDLYTFIYTSGTTGPPKACMIRHRNYYDMISIVDEIPDLVEPDDVLLLFLPLAHNFGRLLHLAGPYIGLTVAYLPDVRKIPRALREVQPTLLVGVPRVFETFHARASAALDKTTGARHRVARWALRIGRAAGERQAARRPLPRALAVQVGLAERLVFAKVKERLGGRMRLAISGGAPLAAEIAQFFHTIGLLVLEGYGLTECTSAATVNRPDWFKFGTVGPALPNVELRLADDGEVLLRTPTIFAGYYKDEEATRAVVDAEGWLHTGDVGSIDADGFLTITDRKKDIIVTAGGKNVSPQNLENALKASRWISQALVVGDRRPYLVALVTLDEQEVANVGRDPRALVQEVVDAVNDGRSDFERIKRFEILPRDFSMEEGEVTPTLKLRRRVVEEHFAGAIDRLYGR